MLDEISELTGATITHDEKGGAAKVYLNGLPLVDENRTYSLDVVITAGGTEFRWSSTPGEYHVIPDMGGKLGGFKEARDQMAGEFKSELEALLRTIVDDINNIHSSGYSANNSTGLNFFDVNPEDYLSSVKVSEVLVSDCDCLAVAKEETVLTVLSHLKLPTGWKVPIGLWKLPISRGGLQVWVNLVLWAKKPKQATIFKNFWSGNWRTGNLL